MDTVGTLLRQARRARGLTLEQVSGATKVPLRTLEDIEDDRLDRLPGGVFAKAHLRACARMVALDPVAVVDVYMRQRFGESGEELPIARPPAVEPAPRRTRYLLMELAAVVVAIGVYASCRIANDGLGKASSRMRTTTPAVAQAPVSDERGQSGFRLEIAPEGTCWVSAVADDRQIVQQLLKKGEHVVTTVRVEVVLHIGDPGTFAYWLNGEPGRTLGEAGEPITVRITGDNYRSYLAATQSS